MAITELTGYKVDLIYPNLFISTWKVRLQGQNQLNKKYKNTWNCFTQIVKKESVNIFHFNVFLVSYSVTKIKR